VIFLFLILIFFPDWPQFRGSSGQGVSDERNLPLTWSETKNIRWKTAIPGRGWSSPVIQGDRLWLTTATEDGRSLRAIAVDVNTGAMQKDVEVFRLKSPKLMNNKNSFASAPTAQRASRSQARSFGKQNSSMTTASMGQADLRFFTTTC
jgi:outer membrane protein assembly factor BamB